MIMTFIVMDAVGVVPAVNVSVPLPCAEQYIWLDAASVNDAGAGDTITMFPDVTPVTLTVALPFDQSDVLIVADVVVGV